MAEKQIEKPVESSVEKDAAFAAVIASAVAKAVAETTAALQAKQSPPENRFPISRDSKNPEGLADKDRPKLRCRYFFCGAELEEKSMTNAEIRKVNEITVPGQYHKGQWRVRTRLDDDGVPTFFIDLPVKTLDQRMEIPRGLIAIIDEILAEEASRQPASAK